VISFVNHESSWDTTGTPGSNVRGVFFSIPPLLLLLEEDESSITSIEYKSSEFASPPPAAASRAIILSLLSFLSFFVIKSIILRLISSSLSSLLLSGSEILFVRDEAGTKWLRANPPSFTLLLLLLLLSSRERCKGERNDGKDGDGDGDGDGDDEHARDDCIVRVAASIIYLLLLSKLKEWGKQKYDFYGFLHLGTATRGCQISALT
jgi:hypothetical protein